MNTKSLRILVTGGAGRVGSLAVRILAKHGHIVNVFDLPTANFGRVDSLNNVKIFKGDLLTLKNLERACQGIDVALHLAAILPPASELNAKQTMSVNATGTANLVETLRSQSSASIVFSSSVSVYGRTKDREPPVTVRNPLKPTDNYSRSKIAAELAIEEGSVPYTILRVTGVYTAELFEFPSPVQFQADQRVEFIDRDDAVSALVTAVEKTPRNRVLNIAGGETWRMKGIEFVEGVFNALGFVGEVDYPLEPGYFDWYDTEESERLLNYQRTSFGHYKTELANAFNI